MRIMSKSYNYFSSFVYQRGIYLCLIAAFMAVTTAYAQEDNTVYVCLSDDGTPTYTNNKAGLSNCKPLSGVTVTTVSAFKLPPLESKPVYSANSTTHTSARNNTVTPTNFPREDFNSQRQRDQLGRRPILEAELRERESRCAATVRTLKAPMPRLVGETDTAFEQRIAAMQVQVERCNADLAAIRRELTNLK